MTLQPHEIYEFKSDYSTAGQGGHLREDYC